MTIFLHRNDKLDTLHNKCSKIPPLDSMHFGTNMCRSRVFRLSWSSRFRMRSVASKTRESKSSPVSTFLLQNPLFIQPHKQKCNLVRSGDSMSSKLGTIQNSSHVHINLFPAMTGTITSQSTDLSPSITLYIAVEQLLCSLQNLGNPSGESITFW